MALCINFSTPTAAYPNGFSLTGVNHVGTVNSTLRFGVVDAVAVDGVYSCPAGAHLLVSVDEANVLFGAVGPAWTAADGLTVGWSILAIWVSVAAVMFLGKIVNWGASPDVPES